MIRRHWTPRDPEPTDVCAVIDNYGELFIPREVTPLAQSWDGRELEWYMPADPVIGFSWPEQWDGYGGDRDVVISEVLPDELAELHPDRDAS